MMQLVRVIARVLLVCWMVSFALVSVIGVAVCVESWNLGLPKTGEYCKTTTFCVAMFIAGLLARRLVWRIGGKIGAA
jgi:hypothetical protein